MIYIKIRHTLIKRIMTLERIIRVEIRYSTSEIYRCQNIEIDSLLACEKKKSKFLFFIHANIYLQKKKMKRMGGNHQNNALFSWYFLFFYTLMDIIDFIICNKKMYICVFILY